MFDSKIVALTSNFLRTNKSTEMLEQTLSSKLDNFANNKSCEPKKIFRAFDEKIFTPVSRHFCRLQSLAFPGTSAPHGKVNQVSR